MTELRCTVQTCVHNKNEYCALNSITVGGSTAKKADDTCCDSFQERKGDTFSNSVGQASLNTRVDCKATDCKYNTQQKCHADKINVEGRCACSTGETECATFAMK